MSNEAAKALKEQLGRLDVQRKSLEMEGEAIISELTAKPESGGEPMGVDTPLVDPDGYPRGDIDVYRARDLRSRFAVIKTDRKNLMAQIDTLLAQLAVVQNPKKTEEEAKEEALRAAPKPKPKFDPKTGKWVVKNWDGTVAGVEDGEGRSFDNLQSTATPATSGGGQTAQPMDVDAAAGTHTTTVTSARHSSGPPFAKIDGVSPLSPASEAGLKEGDLIVEFGTINHTNNDNLRALMPVVTTAADAQQAISIALIRQQESTNQPVNFGNNESKVLVRLGLVPKPWPGRGLIGCHITPYSG